MCCKPLQTLKKQIFIYYCSGNRRRANCVILLVHTGHAMLPVHTGHAIQVFINKSNLTFYPACPHSACPKTHPFNQVKHGETVTPTRPCPGLLVEANRGRAFSTPGGEGIVVGNEVAATVKIGMLHVDIFFLQSFQIKI